MGNDDPEYYPFRWKVADTVEDLFLLHRRTLIAATVVLLGAVVVGVIVLNGDSSVDTTAPGTVDSIPDAGDTTDPNTTSSSTTTTEPTTTSTDTTTTALATTTTTTTIEESTRPVPTPEEIEAAQAGAIVEMSPDSVRLVGGLPSEVVANETIRVVEQIFPGIEVLDQQVVDSSFSQPEALMFRLSAPDLFGYNSDVLNAAYFPPIDQLAEALIEAEFWSVEVVGHTDDSGDADGNRRLSERRARAGANRLIDQGVDEDRVSVFGAGEDDPIADNATDAGQQTNRRIEFVVTEG